MLNHLAALYLNQADHYSKINSFKKWIKLWVFKSSITETSARQTFRLTKQKVKSSPYSCDIYWMSVNATLFALFVIVKRASRAMRTDSTFAFNPPVLVNCPFHVQLMFTYDSFNVTDTSGPSVDQVPDAKHCGWSAAPAHWWGFSTDLIWAHLESFVFPKSQMSYD